MSDIITVIDYISYGNEIIQNSTFRTDFSNWLAPNWVWTLDGASHVVGFTNPLIQPAAVVVPESIYDLSFTINKHHYGTLRTSVGGMTSTYSKDSPTTDIRFKASSANPLTFTPSSDFDGCITELSLKRLEGGVFLIDGVMFFNFPVSSESWEIDVIPISWGIDGSVPPGALSTLTATNKARYRDFAGGADNSVFFEWQVPYGIDVNEAIYFQVEGFITNATAPTVGQTVFFALQGTSLGDSDILSSAMGSTSTVPKTFEAGFVQNDKFNSGWSTEVTIPNLANGELVILNLKRDTTDTYGQAIGVGWLKIMYAKRSQQG